MLRRIALGVCGRVFLGWEARAAAQRNGSAHGHAKSARRPTTAAAPRRAGSEAIQVAGTGIRNCGACLDDASLLTPGQGLMSLGFGLWKMPGYREVDFQSIDTAYGLHPRLQVGVSAPVYYASEPGGPTARGIG